MNNIVIFIETVYIYWRFCHKTDFSQKKGLFYDVTSIFLIWVYACTLRALTPHPPSRVVIIDRPLFHSLLTQIQTPSVEDLNRWLEPKMLHTNWSGVCHVTKCCALFSYRLYRRLLLLYWTPSDWRPSFIVHFDEYFGVFSSTSARRTIPSPAKHKQTKTTQKQIHSHLKKVPVSRSPVVSNEAIRELNSVAVNKHT